MSDPRRDDLKCGADGPGAGGAAGAGIAAGTCWQPALEAARVRLATVASQVQLEFRLGAPEVAGLADSQLDQPRQPVLHHNRCLVPVEAPAATRCRHREYGGSGPGGSWPSHVGLPQRVEVLEPSISGVLSELLAANGRGAATVRRPLCTGWLLPRSGGCAGAGSPADLGCQSG